VRAICLLQQYLSPIAFVVLAGCASQPEQVPEPKPEPPPEKRVHLNLPEPTVDPVPACDCEALARQQENAFDLGVHALAARDYDQARQHFEDHRASGGDEAGREADVGIAFVTVMSEAANRGASDSIESIDERAEVMILALAAVQTLEGRIEALDALNKALSRDLRKREEALKRLRDLTLGQQEG